MSGFFSCLGRIFTGLSNLALAIGPALTTLSLGPVTHAFMLCVAGLAMGYQYLLV